MIRILVLFLIFYPLIMGCGGYFLSKKFPSIRDYYFIFTMCVELIFMLILAFTFSKENETSFTLNYILSLGLSFKVDAFRVIYATISIFLWLMTITFSKEYMHHYDSKERYYLFYLVTLCGVVGVFFSSDLFTTFCFFELMSFASYPLVIHDESKDAMKAGETYLAVAVISGMILLLGLFFINFQTQTLSFDGIKEYYKLNSISPLSWCGGILILLGFGAKAGMYPLHIWLPKAHPVAPAPASALLSGILTKTGVFGIIVLCANMFFGNDEFGFILLLLATITMFLGALLALFSTNLKRTLACSSMSQIGFILLSLSFMVLLKEEGAINANGALLHMANHSLIKLVLFMCAGVVACNIHELELNKIKGFGRKKPFLMIIFLIGALGIGGFPFLNGYVSKTMIHEGIVEYIKINNLIGNQYLFIKSIEWIFLISGGFTVAYMLKLFICLFVEKNNDEEKQKEFDGMKNYLPPLSRVVFIISAIPLLIIGILPNIINLNIVSSSYSFFGVEKFTHHISFFGWECVKGALISLLIGAFTYLVVCRLLLIKKGNYINLWPSSLDLEKIIYRPILIKGTYYFVSYFVSYISSFMEILLTKGIYIFIVYFVRYITYAIDFIILILNKTIFKSHVYKFKDITLSQRLGAFIDKHLKTKDNKYEKKMDSFKEIITDTISEETNSFSFAFAMISLGIIIVLLFAIFISG